MGLDRETVARFVHADAFPERAARPYLTFVDAFAEYLGGRWRAGCPNAAQLARELAIRGFTGSYGAVIRYVARWRGTESGSSADTQPVASETMRAPSARRVAILLLRGDDQLAPEERASVDALARQDPKLTAAARLAQEFGELIRQQHPDELDGWVRRAVAPGVPHELHTFATGLRSDYSPVKASLSSPSSNGQVEGQVNRVKLIKRQMYGRAKFDLLRQRVLYCG